MTEHLFRASAYEGFVPLVRQLGADAEVLLGQVGIDPADLEDPESLTSYRKFTEVLELAADATRKPHFGLLLAARQRFSMLGAVGFTVREAPDILTAIRALNEFIHVHNPAVHGELRTEGDIAIWSVEILMPDAPRLHIQYDLTAGVGCNIMRYLAGRSWAPNSVYLKRPTPADKRPYQQFFQAPLVFGADLNAIVFPKHLLTATSPASNRRLFEILHAYLVEMAARKPVDFVSLVRETIALALRDGQYAIEDVAQRLGMSQRTLQRRLHTAGFTYKELLSEVRKGVAIEYLRNPAVSLTRIATALGYSELAAFSRWFRRDFGHSPSQWRARNLEQDGRR